jgi:hypothetical protein
VASGLSFNAQSNRLGKIRDGVSMGLPWLRMPSLMGLSKRVFPTFLNKPVRLLIHLF